MNRWRTRTAALLLTAPLALTAACSGDSGEAEVDVDTPEVEAPEVPDVEAPDVDVETEG